MEEGHDAGRKYHNFIDYDKTRLYFYSYNMQFVAILIALHLPRRYEFGHDNTGKQNSYIKTALGRGVANNVSAMNATIGRGIVCYRYTLFYLVVLVQVHV